MLQRFLDPTILANISHLELVAKTVVDGFISGLHRSPDFGFSQEFAEYRSYNPGDDLRHVDWNVFARTDKCFLKRYRGETNSQLTVLLDASASMTYTAGGVSKLDYARFLSASMIYMAAQQRDATGIIVFDDDVREYIRPSGRQGQVHRILHAIEKAEGGARTNFGKPFLHYQEFHRKRGIAMVISDFYEEPEKIVKALEPLRFRGNEVILFHILDPREIAPTLNDPALFVDMETQTTIEVTPDFVRNEYRAKIDGHITALKTKARASNMDYVLCPTDKPLDAALREYLTIRQGRL